MAKRGKKPSFSDTGTKREGMSVYSGKTRLTKESPEIVGEFLVPSSLEDVVKIKDQTQKDKWYSYLVGGAYMQFARMLRATNDTMIEWKGEKIDAFGGKLSRKQIAKFLTASYRIS